jgi:metal-responsive CopG/Arc/MetJ family transcriptional regulator
MAKPTTIRIPEDLLNEIDQVVKELNLDRSAFLRDVLRKGFSLDRQERLLRLYHRGELSLQETCHELKINPWEFFSMLQSHNLHLNVGLEDWLDSDTLSN